MKLDNIELENFRQYYGKQRAAFSRDPTRNITVFNGSNGVGKTSLFVAINWCLYGEGAEHIGELISKEAVKRSRTNEQVRARVKLTFLHSGERYVVERELVGVKQENGTIDIQSKPTFTLMRIRADGQAKEEKNPVGMMNTILPSNVRTFFLFDGEKIDDFAKPDSADEVRYAIYNVLKLEVLERAQKHLSDIAAEYRRELKQTTSGELRELLEEYDKKKKEKDDTAARLQELEDERDSAKRKIGDIDKRLRQLQSARDLQLQRDRIQRDLEDRESELRGLVRDIRDTVISLSSTIAETALNKACTVLDQKRARGEIPSGIRQQFIHDLLEQGKCICGRPLKEGDPAHSHLTKRLAQTVSGSLEDKVLRTNFGMAHNTLKVSLTL